VPSELIEFRDAQVAEIEHFNGNPVAVFWGEKEL
jgi:hypothetical protein